ncbi:hypothetical protein BAE30_07960 [Acidithiobacillus caldus]|uniref:Uncharacterized protein n=1 Tax=Acidithiobacillus caldus TaxID=33059 RepID=A0A1E7YVP9_9PROT|nr:hypothetical protein BAE30_07960 [Acidithiobacillus caldus]
MKKLALFSTLLLVFSTAATAATTATATANRMAETPTPSQDITKSAGNSFISGHIATVIARMKNGYIVKEDGGSRVYLVLTHHPMYIGERLFYVGDDFSTPAEFDPLPKDFFK